MTDTQLSITHFINQFSKGIFAELVTNSWQRPEKPAEINGFPADLHPELISALKSDGLNGLYRHQIDCWKVVSRGENIVIATGTSSGKTLCYNLPVLNSILHNPDATALYLFPTKALTEDQYKKITAFTSSLKELFKIENKQPVMAGIYDGDTITSKRIAIRNKANIILTNPDMLHLGILPHHTSWYRFLSKLKFVIIDEIHTYRGILGSHVSNVIRRLKRILNFYGSSPQFILASATISNPEELAKKLIEEEITCITKDTSSQVERFYCFLNPPIIDRDLGLRKSLIDQSVEIAVEAIQENVQSLIFARSRKTVELTLKQIKEITLNNEQEFFGYRSGYLPRERRYIESGLRDGSIKTVVSTNAMELGIDMGGVDAVILMGYPGSIASFLQQSGRAGRRDRSSLAVLVASSSPLDQYIIRHPDFIKGKNPEKALLDANNPLILINHLRCALFELPFEPNEKFGNLEWQQIKPYLEVLASLSQAIECNGKYTWRSEQYPANEISLRNINNQSFRLRLITNEAPISIGDVDYQSAARMIHQGAVYFHNGESYKVTKLDFKEFIADLEIHQDDYYTEPKTDTQVDIIQMIKEKKQTNLSKIFAEMKVIETVKGYKKIDWHTRQVISHHELDLPENELQTVGLGLKFGHNLVEVLREKDLWLNDTNDYGPKWNEIRKKIINRDQNKCQVCGQTLEISVLHVHHKIPFRSFRVKDEANRFDNLITLCSNCHRYAERNIKIRSGLSGFSYIFTQIAPLHLMCDQRDIGSFAEPVSKYNERLPIVIIYDQFPGGIGLSAELFEKAEPVMTDCLESIRTCPCSNGCPACVGPAGENGIGGKEAAAQIFEQLLK